MYLRGHIPRSLVLPALLITHHTLHILPSPSSAQSATTTSTFKQNSFRRPRLSCHHEVLHSHTVDNLHFGTRYCLGWSLCIWHLPGRMRSTRGCVLLWDRCHLWSHMRLGCYACCVSLQCCIWTVSSFLLVGGIGSHLLIDYLPTSTCWPAPMY